MNHFESQEDYLERILMLSKEKKIVRAIDIANSMNYSKPSVSIALKKLKNLELINVDETNGSITLTTKGNQIASSIYERHKIISELLISIGVDEETALIDACKLEHVLSPISFDKIKELLQKNK